MEDHGAKTVQCTKPLHIVIRDGNTLLGEVIVRPKTQVASDAIELVRFNRTSADHRNAFPPNRTSRSALP